MLPIQGGAGAGYLQKAQASNRAGFERTAHATAIARLALGRFGRGVAVEMDEALVHAGNELFSLATSPNPTICTRSLP